jgi:acyl carrier protein
MPDDLVEAPEPILARLVERQLAQKSVIRAVGPEDELVALGLTSVDMLGLMLAIESEFGLTIPPTDITPENFHSVAALAMLVRRLG